LGGESGSLEYEMKKGFAYGYPIQGQIQSKLEGPNIWPTTFDQRNIKIFEDYFMKSCDLAQTLNQLLSEAFTGSKDCWGTYFKTGDRISIMRIFQYLPSGEGLGSSPHTDWGGLTLIKAQESIAALQIAVEQPGEANTLDWLDVPAKPIGGSDLYDYWIVNTGDYYHKLSHGQIVSPLHRVRSTNEHRTSFVFFHYPSYFENIPDYTSKAISVDKNQSLERENSRLGKLEYYGDLILEKWKEVSRM
jgi:isopenicillin N synthase-like dioxygenase